MCGTLIRRIRLGLGAEVGAAGGVGIVASGKGVSNGLCGGPTTPGGAGAVGFSSQGGRPEMMEGSGVPLWVGRSPIGTLSQSEPGPGRGL